MSAKPGPNVALVPKKNLANDKNLKTFKSPRLAYCTNKMICLQQVGSMAMRARDEGRAAFRTLCRIEMCGPRSDEGKTKGSGRDVEMVLEIMYSYAMVYVRD